MKVGPGMHLVYAVTTCSDRLYRQLFADTAEKPAFQAQKYHRLLMEGLSSAASVDVVATLPLTQKLMKTAVVAPQSETENGVHYHYVSAYRNPKRRIVHNALSVFFKTLRMAKRGDGVVVDCLNSTTAVFAVLAAKLRGAKSVGIVTDLPEMVISSARAQKVSAWVIGQCTHYVFLTEAMNARLNPGHKPYVILEGHCDASMAEVEPSLERKKSLRICMYAGGVVAKYGLNYLVDGFRLADIPDAKLVIYGPGKYVPVLEKIAEQDSRIEYGGMLFNREIVERELEATVLINPRPTCEEFVKYSFPSKTMEYMVSGTPTITTDLPGMPREYLPYVYLISEETPQGIAEVLRRVLSQDKETLHTFGMQAREFVLKNKTNKIQAKKILEMLK